MDFRVARFWRRLGHLFRRARLDRELSQELEFHRAMKQLEAEAAGLDRVSAAQAAHRAMGNLMSAKESSREAWMFLRPETWLSDARYAVRVLAAKPVFTVCAVLTLALGIGANTAIFSLIDALLLRGLPVPEPERLVQVHLKGEDDMTSLSYPLFLAISERQLSFSGVFSWNMTDLWMGSGPQAIPVSGAVMSGDGYRTLNLRPQAGRLFTMDDDLTGAPLCVVISDRFWEREFQRDPHAIGRTLVLNGKPFTVIGITPRNFLGITAGASPDVTIPVHANAVLHPQWHILESKSSWYLSVVARLRPGVTIARARSELRALSPPIMLDQVWENDPARRKQFLAQTLDLIPGATGSSWLARRYRRSLLLLMAISGVVLLLACVNLASLSLARVAPRQKELSVRLALGAARARLVRQLLTESVLIALAGAAFAAAFSFWATRGLVALLSPQGAPLVLDLNPDWRVLGLLGALAIATGLIFGAAPAIQGSALQPHDALKQSKIGLARSGHRFQLGKALVAVQVGLSVLLIGGAMLFVETLENLKRQKTGFDRNNVVFAEIDADSVGINERQLPELYRSLLASLRRNGAVRFASLTNQAPLAGGYEWENLQPELWPKLSAQERMLFVHRVAPQYFQTMGLPLLRGRDFVGTDSQAAEQPGILSASAARTYFPGVDPLGKLLHQDATTAYRIIGVADDAHYADLRTPSPRTIYLKHQGNHGAELVVRGSLDKWALARELRSLLRKTDAGVRLGRTISLTERIDESLVTERLTALLASFFGGVAAVLVAIGLYGVVGYGAARRTSEIGVRLALGATPPSVLWLVIREALLLSAIGIAGGVPAVLFCGRLVKGMLYGVKTQDFGTLAATVALILTIAAIAGLIPALRASRLDPVGALRYE